MGFSFLPLLFLPLRDCPEPLKDTLADAALDEPPGNELPSPETDGVDVPDEETESILVLSILSLDAMVGGGGRGLGAGST